MKTFGGVVLVLLFTVAGWAQAGKANCPQINVLGPAGTFSPGQPMRYTLSITGEPAGRALEFVWTTTDGTIVRGQGTREVVVGGWTGERGVTVTVAIKGLPTDCPSLWSETMFYDPPPQSRLVDEYGPPAFAAVREYLLDSAAKDFHENQPPYPAKFRRVRIGHVGDVTKSGSYRLCGEFLPVDGEAGVKPKWTGFATIKTSGYEQYVGPTTYCTDKKIRWDTKGDLASVLKGKLDALKKD